MYLRLKSSDLASLTAALKACDAGFVAEVPRPAHLSVTTEEGWPAVDVTRHYAIVQASHRHAIVHGLTFVSAPAVIGEGGEVLEAAVLAEGYHADLTGDAVTEAVQDTLEANGVQIVTPETPQHVLG